MEYNITPKEAYEILCRNIEIKDIYKDIEKFEIESKGIALHNMRHVKNVTSTVEQLLRCLNYDEDTIYNSKTACLLHDIGALEGKDNHAERSYEYAKKYFDFHEWNFKGMTSILNAIRYHSNGSDSDDIITLVLVLADKLDIRNSRITEEGLKVEGNRQYAHIEDIEIKIDNKVLKINFITDCQVDMDEINNYYFTKKVFNAIDSFSQKVGLSYSVMMDGLTWDLDDPRKKEFFVDVKMM